MTCLVYENLRYDTITVSHYVKRSTADSDQLFCMSAEDRTGGN